MHNAIQPSTLPARVFPVAENSTAERGAVEGAGGAVGRGGEQEVRGGGPEVRDDAVVGAGAGLDDGAGEEVGVDDGEGVRGGAEEVGDGGFAGGDGAGEAEEEHDCSAGGWMGGWGRMGWLW